MRESPAGEASGASRTGGTDGQQDSKPADDIIWNGVAVCVGVPPVTNLRRETLTALGMRRVWLDGIRSAPSLPLGAGWRGEQSR